MGNGDGVELTLDNTAVTNSLVMNGINAVNNGEDGLQLNFLNGATIPMGSVIDLGTFNDNGQHGVNLTVNNSADRPEHHKLDGQHGVDCLDVQTTAAERPQRRTGTRRADAGRSRQSDHQAEQWAAASFVQAATPSTFISNNSFTNNEIADNGGFGFRGIFNSGMFDITLGGTGNGNLFSNNVGAAINVDMIQKHGWASCESSTTRSSAPTTAARRIQRGRHLHPPTRHGQSGSGDQLAAEPLGSAGVTRSADSEQPHRRQRRWVMADGNASHGIFFQSEEQSSINGLHVHDNSGVPTTAPTVHQLHSARPGRRQRLPDPAERSQRQPGRRRRDCSARTIRRTSCS